ncbi:hypothetical protein JHK85_008877 [Glycine max]|nr:hypothetical protein JHK87_008491 [Glycine soja]KAG5047774.1 hypothetical protein JHK85_008877 [Glycine max]RZC14285.1 hypothetical protein D0Y65_008330 [Glycine soja]
MLPGLAVETLGLHPKSRSIQSILRNRSLITKSKCLQFEEFLRLNALDSQIKQAFIDISSTVQLFVFIVIEVWSKLGISSSDVR